MRFVPYTRLGTTPNLIVDGQSNSATICNLSHWPHSGTLQELKDDLSAQIVFHYLDRPDLHVDVEAVSNDHFDEDGLVSLHSIINPEHALRHRDLLIDVAAAGDFGTYKFREAARAVFVISAYADKEFSPLNKSLFQKPYPEMAAGLYEQLLPILPDVIEKLDQYREWWHDEDSFLDVSEDAIRTGNIIIEDNASMDLAVVTMPESNLKNRAHRFTQVRSDWCHPMAINNATNCFRVLLICGRQYEFQYRYESWVQYISRKPLPRVDLNTFAEQLTEQEGGGIWKFDGVGEITPSLHLTNAIESHIDPADFRQQLETFLAVAPSAWDPYDRFPDDIRKPLRI